MHIKDLRRNTWFQVNGPCVKCGSWENLELDHINPKLKVTHRIWSWSQSKREVELSKCQVLCKICHKEKTSNEKRERYSKNWKHGTLTGYYNRKCRCDSCKGTYHKYRRSLYLKKGI